jgi:lipopolysaccharide assembly outer membrane protein LptD (OstA)
MRITVAILALLLLNALAAVRAEDPPADDWDFQARNDASKLSYEPGGDVVATGGFTVRYRDTYLVADQARFNQATGDIHAEGSVRVERKGEVWTGEKLDYNFKTRLFSGTDFRTGQLPFFASGHSLKSNPEDHSYTATDATLTTDDYADPGYVVRARRIMIVPGEYIKAQGAWVKIGKLPIMYLPQWTRSLRRHPNHWVLQPGYRSRFGPYLLSSYHHYFSDKVDMSLDIDYRQKRGVGYGPELRYDLPEIGQGEVKYYRTHDDLPGLDPSLRPIPTERQRFWMEHQWENASSNLTVKAAVRYQSDAQVVRDFFEPEYRRNVQPATYVEVEKSWRNWNLNTLVLPRVNDVFETVERLPDVKLSGLRQQIGETPLFYESESSMGYFHRRFADHALESYGAYRGDSFHQVVLPETFFNWLNVTPRVGVRGTAYGEENGVGTTLSERQRFVFNTGAEFSTKASRLWRGAQNRFFEIDGLRHIVEPSLNYVFVPTPTRAPPELAQFDYELPSRRLLPITYPDYNAIDSIDSQNVLRLGLRNKLQTKREDRVQDVVAWALYTDWRLKPRPDQGTFADLYSDLDVSPFHWLTFSSELRYNLDDGYWREANHLVTLVPNDVWSFSIGHRYLRDDPIYGPDSGHNLISTKFYYRFSENWGFRSMQHFEARDGKMEEQTYTVYRDFRSWTGALTFRVRESRLPGVSTDYTVAVVFNLKAFPRFKQGDDVNRHELL